MGMLLKTNPADVMGQIWFFLKGVFDLLANLWFWPIIFLGLCILSIIVMFFLIKFSYENRILKSVNRLNKYFLAKPFITDDNLVEFNLKMKKVPKVLRNNWQIYMLNREDAPTKYINVESCIDKPLRTSSIEKNMSNFTVFSVFLGVLSFVSGVSYANMKNLAAVGDVLFFAAAVPMLIMILYTIFIFVMRSVKNDIYSCLYENFPLYERNLTKAVSTLPAYVDYEILFTKKEIKEGIPILQQYLEKRDLIEQKELEKARENSEPSQEYDFDDLGIDASLVLERAMKETETFLKNKARLTEEKTTIETQKENFRKSFETTSKDLERKLQASRENMDSLKSQQEASTNRIESNYLRKQLADEIKKQEEIQKNVEEESTRFNETQSKFDSEIQGKEKDIEDNRQSVEKAMLTEFKHYANSLYEALTQKATEVANQKLLGLSQENADLKALLTDLQGTGTAKQPIDTSSKLIKPAEVTNKALYEDVGAQDQNEKESEGKEDEEDVSNDKDKLKNDTETTDEDNGEDAGKKMENENVENAEPKEEEPIENEEESTENKEDESKEDENEDDIVKIQKQIDDENSKLQADRQEFVNDLDNTISHMEDQSKEVKVEKEEVEEPKPEKKEESSEENTEEEEPPRGGRFSRSKKYRAPKKRRRSEQKGSADLDKLDSEMDKLLKSDDN